MGNKEISSLRESPLKNKCEKCGAFVKNLYNHNYHTHQEKIIPCPVCKKTFKRIGHLNLHLKRHDAQPTQCDVCDKFVININDHKNFSHMKREDLPCSICNGKYKSKRVLNSHIRTHSTQPEKCNMCDLMVSNIYGHKARVHSEAKLCQKKNVQNVNKL